MNLLISDDTRFLMILDFWWYLDLLFSGGTRFSRYGFITFRFILFWRY